jgi:hypothetical protein
LIEAHPNFKGNKCVDQRVKLYRNSLSSVESYVTIKYTTSSKHGEKFHSPTKINKEMLSKLHTIMAVSTVLNISNNRTSLKRLERRTGAEEIKFLKCGARIWL